MRWLVLLLVALAGCQKTEWQRPDYACWAKPTPDTVRYEACWRRADEIYDSRRCVRINDTSDRVCVDLTFLPEGLSYFSFVALSSEHVTGMDPTEYRRFCVEGECYEPLGGLTSGR